MNESINKADNSTVIPFTSIALAERKIATEIIERDSIRLIPRVYYKAATLEIVNTLFHKTYDFNRKERIDVDVSMLKDGLYFYILSLSLSYNIGEDSKAINKTVFQKGKFAMSAGISRDYNSKWGVII